MALEDIVTSAIVYPWQHVCTRMIYTGESAFDAYCHIRRERGFSGYWDGFCYEICSKILCIGIQAISRKAENWYKEYKNEQHDANKKKKYNKSAITTSFVTFAVNTKNNMPLTLVAIAAAPIVCPLF
ncbi:hypothetical protein RFI_15474 [Reticulomyxa filosa]|uniref:Uncharacterized protein n=1 Tax=Reticulomyxa filosa TaxID=46433 RepID=X6N6P6_RETFI|nr:hypothetical protein RFI_15474 [Reticulomyxa filosa]|eukprot:ETO21726.1 hypothetical protein RFI_15474 [Reticulomyxa filosa]